MLSINHNYVLSSTTKLFFCMWLCHCGTWFISILCENIYCSFYEHFRVCVCVYLLLDRCNNSIFRGGTHPNRQCEQICCFTDRCLRVNMNVHWRLCVCVYLCALCALALLAFSGVNMKEEIPAGFQTRLLPEPPRKLNESGCKNVFIIWFPSPDAGHWIPHYNRLSTSAPGAWL